MTESSEDEQENLNRHLGEGSSSGIHENTTPSKFSHFYKSGKVPKNQEDRRKELLLQLKKRRTQLVDEKREITELFEDDVAEESLEQMEIECILPKQIPHFKKYYNRLMCSEWFTHIPNDLERNWLVKLCPVGNRNLVIAAQNMTKAYTKAGKEKLVFDSLLPGGGGKLVYGRRKPSFTVLDCVFNRFEKRFYVLDILAWNSFSVKKCTTDFRFFWLKSKFEENPELQGRSSLNEYPFIFIKSFLAETPLLEELFSKPYFSSSEDSKLDGVLFYHKETPYIRGITPLVGWLKPYMLSEKLHIPVHQSYMQNRPAYYTGLDDYIKVVETKYQKKLKRRKGILNEEPDSMDTVEIETPQSLT